jgi:hypothetical protein
VASAPEASRATAAALSSTTWFWVAFRSTAVTRPAPAASSDSAVQPPELTHTTRAPGRAPSPSPSISSTGSSRTCPKNSRPSSAPGAEMRRQGVPASAPRTDRRAGAPPAPDDSRTAAAVMRPPATRARG